MGSLYGESIDLDDPFFGRLTDDERILRQRAELALDTPRGFLDGFPEHGFVWSEQVLRALDPTGLALLPLEVRTALEQEPSIATADVSTASTTPTPGGGAAVSLALQMTGHEGDAVGFNISTPVTG